MGSDNDYIVAHDAKRMPAGLGAVVHLSVLKAFLRSRGPAPYMANAGGGAQHQLSGAGPRMAAAAGSVGTCTGRAG